MSTAPPTLRDPMLWNTIETKATPIVETIERKVNEDERADARLSGPGLKDTVSASEAVPLSVQLTLKALCVPLVPVIVVTDTLQPCEGVVGTVIVLGLERTADAEIKAGIATPITIMKTPRR